MEMGVDAGRNHRLKPDQEVRNLFCDYFLEKVDAVFTYSLNFQGTQNVPIFFGDVERFLGFTRQEIESGEINWRDRVHPDDVHIMDRAFADLDADPKSFAEAEYRFLRKDGQWQWIRGVSFPILDDHGEFQGVQGIIENIGERKVVELRNDRLMAEFKQFQSIVNNSFAVAYRRDVEADMIKYLSENVIQFGVTAEQIKAGDVLWSSLIHPDDHARVLDELDRCFREDREILQQDYRLVDRDGQVRWVEDFCTILRNRDGAVTHTQGILMEISPRKRLEHEVAKNQEHLEQQKSELEAKNIALREMIHQVETERDRALGELLANVDRTIMPTVRRLKRSTSNEAVLYGEMLEESIESLAKPFARPLTDPIYDFTPREVEVCHLIRNGFGTKEIAQQLSVSISTVSAHRRNIRKKLKLVDTHKNLSTALKSLKTSL
jgi:PAS domain S-box-containing protein